MRRAGSPVQRSRGPSTAKSMPAACSSRAIDRVASLRPLVERARRTRPRTGTSGAGSPGCSTRTSSPSAQSSARRLPAGPTGSRPGPRRRGASRRPPRGTATRPSRGAGAGRRSCRRARCRPGTRARTRRTSRSPTRPRRSPRSARAAAARPRRRPSRHGRSPRRGRAASMISSFGLSGLPVAQAGQTSWQRPHSVHENRSSICFLERSVGGGGAEPHVLLGSLEVDARAARGDRSGPVFASHTFGAAVMMCRCLDPGR